LLCRSGHSMTQWLDASLFLCDSGGMLDKSEIRKQKSEGNPKSEVRRQKPEEDLGGEFDLVASGVQRWPMRPNNSDFGIPSGFGFRIFLARARWNGL
jgi:hypothetical protein